MPSQALAVADQIPLGVRLVPALLGVLLALAAAAINPASALADTKTWVGVEIGANWSAPANWAGFVAPVAGDDLVFPSNALRFRTNNDYPSGTIFKSITIQSSGYSLNGNSVLISGIVATYATGSSTISLPITAFSSNIIVNEAGATLVFSNTYNDNNGVRKLGLGTMVLQGVSSAGSWAVEAGILNLQNGGAGVGGVNVFPAGTLQVQNSIALPVPITLNGTTGAANATGGLESVSGNNTLTGPINVFNNSTMSVDGGSTLTVTTNPLNLNNFTLTANVAGTATIASPIQGAGGLTKTGAGVLTLSGTNPYTGPTTVGAGTLLVNGSGPSSVTVASGATLGGTGTTGPLIANGTVSPGAGGPGVLHTGNATFNGNSTFAVDLNGTTVGSGYDQLFATGAITLSGPMLAVTVGFASAPGNVFAILQSTGPISGAFAGLPEGFTFTSGGRTFRINYTPNAVTLTDVTPARILGDINGDGFVDVRDYGVWRASFGQTNCGNAADLDGNCLVDIRDYGIWRQHFGEGTPADRRPGAALPAGISSAPRGTPGLVAAP